MAVLQTAPLTTWVRRPKFHQHDHYVHDDHGSIGDLPVLAADCNTPSCNILRQMLTGFMRLRVFPPALGILLLTFVPIWAGQIRVFSQQQVDQLIKQEKYTEAEQLLREQLKHHPNPESSDVQHLLGLTLLRQYRFAEAEPFLRQATAAAPTKHAWLHDLANTLFQQQRCTEALAVLQRCLTLQASPLYSYDAARSALCTGDLSLAQHAFKTALTALDDPSQTSQTSPEVSSSLRPLIMYELGKLSVNRGDYAAAIVLLHQTLKLHAEHSEARFLLGLAEWRAGTLQAAVNAFQTVLDQVPGHVGATYNLGLSLAQMGEKKESQAVLRTFSGLNTNQEKIEQLRIAVKNHPTKPQLHIDIAQLYLEVGKTEMALPHLMAARRLVPTRVDVHRLFAQAYQRQGRTAAAARARRFANSLSEQTSSE